MKTLSLATLLLSFAISAPSQASDLLDCLETGVLPLTNLNDIKETAEFLYNNGECVPYILPPDPVRIGVIVGGGEAVKLTNKKYNFYSGKNQCESLAGNTVAKALLSTGFGDVFNVIDSHAKQYLQQAASDGANEALSQVPVIGGFLPCICGFSVTNFSFDNPKDIFNKYATSIQACENVAGAIAAAATDVWNAIKSVFGGSDPFTYDKFYSFAYAPYVQATLYASQPDLSQYLSGVSQMCHLLVSVPFDLTTFDDNGCNQMQNQFLASRNALLQAQAQALAAAAQQQQDAVNAEAKKKQDAIDAAEKQQHQADLALKKSSVEFARSFTILQYAIQSKKCTDAQCLKEMEGVNFFYSFSLYDAFYKNGGNAADALNKAKSVAVVYGQKADQSAMRALARAAEAATQAKAMAQQYSGKLAVLAPRISRARLVGTNLRVRSKADFTRLVQTHAKPNMYHGRPYPRQNQ